MNSESYKFSNLDEAINLLQELKKKNKNGTIVISTFDYDNDRESKKETTPDEGCLLVRKSKTIVINEDTFIPHMQLYSTVQSDLENIIKKGIMHDVILKGL